MSSYDYGWEKLHNAIHCLAGEGGQAERLINAVSVNLIHIRPAQDLPPQIRDAFIAFMKRLTSVQPSGHEGTIVATVGTLKSTELRQAIGEIISFYDAVCRHMEHD